MRPEQLTKNVIRDVEKFYCSFNAARFGSLRDLAGNPYEVEIRVFGDALAVKNKSPWLCSKQRVIGFGASDALHLNDLLSWYRRDGLSCSILVNYGEMNPSLFRQFVAAGLVSNGSGTTIAWMNSATPDQPSSGLVIRESLVEERESYLDLFARCFPDRPEEDPNYRAIQWAEDAYPNGKRYIAELDGLPVGFASMPVIDGVAICGTAGTFPEFRRRGIQRCLIERRIADSAAMGCSLLLGGADLGSTPHRNFLRCGFRFLPLGMSWADMADRESG